MCLIDIFLKCIFQHALNAFPTRARIAGLSGGAGLGSGLAGPQGAPGLAARSASSKIGPNLGGRGPTRGRKFAPNAPLVGSPAPPAGGSEGERGAFVTNIKEQFLRLIPRRRQKRPKMSRAAPLHNFAASATPAGTTFPRGRPAFEQAVASYNCF